MTYEPRAPLKVGDHAWWFATEPVGKGGERHRFVGAARVRIAAVHNVDEYHVEILYASGASVESKKQLGVMPYVRRCDLYATHGPEHDAFGIRVASMGRIE